MNIRQLLPSVAFFGAVSLSLSTGERAQGQTSAATDPVGFTTAVLPANSDSLISIPLTRPAEFTGTISAISGNTITVAATSPFTANQFQYVQSTQPKTYYAIIGPNFATVTGTLAATNGSTAVTGTGTAFTTQITAGDEILINGAAATVAVVNSATSLTLVSPFIGTTATGASATYDHSPKEGSFYTVTGNGTNTLTVNLNGDSLTSIASNLGNTSVTLIPYWTLGTAFPATDSNVSFTPSTSTKSRGTVILMPDLTGTGTDLTSPALYFFLNGAWRLAGADSTVAYDDTILPTATYFTVRNSTATTTFTPTGSVYMNRLSVPLDTQTSGLQDNAVAVTRPAGVALNDLGLTASGAFVASPSPKNRADLLLTYDNTATGYDKTTNAIYFFYNGAWRLAGADTTVDYGGTVIPYGAALTIRKAATSTGATAFWQNARNY